MWLERRAASMPNHPLSHYNRAVLINKCSVAWNLGIRNWKLSSTKDKEKNNFNKKKIVRRTATMLAESLIKTHYE